MHRPLPSVRARLGPNAEVVVLDVIYLLATVAFFGLMLAYVRACEQLGHEPTSDEERA